MKTNNNTQDNKKQAGDKRFIPAPIPLAHPDIFLPKKNKSLVLNLMSNPTDDNSQTYDLTKKISTGTPKEWFPFQLDLKKVIVGQKITLVPVKYAIARTLWLEKLFQYSTPMLQNMGTKKNNFILSSQSLTAHIFPQRSFAFQERYMRHHMRKPR
jgi:hypothetical protein